MVSSGYNCFALNRWLLLIVVKSPPEGAKDISVGKGLVTWACLVLSVLVNFFFFKEKNLILVYEIPFAVK